MCSEIFFLKTMKNRFKGYFTHIFSFEIYVKLQSIIQLSPTLTFLILAVFCV